MGRMPCREPACGWPGALTMVLMVVIIFDIDIDVKIVRRMSGARDERRPTWT